MKCTDKERQTCNDNNDRDIEILEEFIKYYESEAISRKFRGTLSISVDEYDIDAIENLIKAYKELKEENKELISDNLDYQRTLDIFDKRTYRKKYLEERRKEEPNLLYPDADEIYKRYYKLREENKELKKDNKRYEKELHDVIEFSIPVSLVEEKIEELKKYRDIAKELLKKKVVIADSDSLNYGRAEAHDKDIQVLQELLEKRK